jgi:hypothetical protein
MVSPRYYRLQAQVFTLWALAATNPATQQRLRARADEYLRLAERLEGGAQAQPQAGQQQQQIQPKKPEAD